jgi:hypothetical protein
MAIDRKKLALIHIIKKELAFSDDVYRNILRDAANVASAKDLDEVGFRKLMNYFVRSKYYQINPFGLTIKQKLFIKYLAEELGWDEEHFNNFLHKYYHVSGVDNLTRKEASHAIESLKSIGQHKKYPAIGEV